jgi:hypothetical protein
MMMEKEIMIILMKKGGREENADAVNETNAKQGTMRSINKRKICTVILQRQ